MYTVGVWVHSYVDLLVSILILFFQLVVDWLERNALSNLESFPAKVNYFADSVTWENTLLDIQSGLNQGHLVTEVVRDLIPCSCR